MRGPIPLGARKGVVVAAATVLLLREFGLFRFTIPQNARLVPQFVTRVPFWGALQFGTEMGTGMRTYSPTGLPHIVVLAVLLLASWSEAGMAGVGFATGRALMLLTFLTASNKETADDVFTFSLPRLAPLLAVIIVPALTVVVLG